MAKFVHSMIRVLDEARSVDFYGRAFNLKVADRLDFENFTLIYLSNHENTFELELTVNKGQDGPYALGNGYGHSAFVVDDVDAEHARFEEAGFFSAQTGGFRTRRPQAGAVFLRPGPGRLPDRGHSKTGRYR